MPSTEEHTRLHWSDDAAPGIGTGLVCYQVTGIWTYRIMHCEDIRERELLDLVKRASARTEMRPLPLYIFASATIGSEEATLFADQGWRWVFVGTATSTEAAQAVVEREPQGRPQEWEGLGVAYL